MPAHVTHIAGNQLANGRFRDDLFYRLAVFRVHLRSLRERATTSWCRPTGSCASSANAWARGTSG